MSIFIYFDSIIEFAEAFIAFLVAYYALKFYRITRDNSLLPLHLSFTSLGAGLSTHRITIIFAYALLILRRTNFKLLTRILLTSGLILFLSEAIGYGILVFSYLKLVKRKPIEATAPIILLPTIKPPPYWFLTYFRYHPTLEIIIICLLLYITYQTIINYVEKRSSGPLLVSLGFLFLTIGHIIFLFSSIFLTLYLIAHIIHLIGFLYIFTMLLKVTKKWLEKANTDLKSEL